MKRGGHQGTRWRCSLTNHIRYLHNLSPFHRVFAICSRSWSSKAKDCQSHSHWGCPGFSHEAAVAPLCSVVMCFLVRGYFSESSCCCSAVQGLSMFGHGFLARFESAECSSPLLDEITLVDTPGVLSGEKQRIERNYDFIQVEIFCHWPCVGSQ